MVVLEEAGQYPILDHVVMNVSDFSFLWKGWRKGFIYLFFDCLSISFFVSHFNFCKVSACDVFLVFWGIALPCFFFPIL